MENKCNEEGVTTPYITDAEITAEILIYIKIAFIPATIITQYIPFKDGLRVRTLLNLLMLIKVLNNPSKAMLLRVGCMGQESTQHGLAYLVKLGLIRICGKPRLIIPFQAYKIDKGYTITVKGENVIRRIFNHEIIGKNKINKKSEKNT